MLAGRGVKLDQIVKPMPTFTEDTLDQWVDPQWTLSTPNGPAVGPKDSFMNEQFLSGLFNDPASG
jgi:hypothetical protein